MNRASRLVLAATLALAPIAASAEPFVFDESCGNTIEFGFDANVPLAGLDIPSRETVTTDACLSGGTDLELGRDGFFEGTRLLIELPDDPTFTFDLVMDGEVDPVVTIDANLTDVSFLFSQRGAATPSEPASGQIPGEIDATGTADFDYSGPLAGEFGPIFDQFLMGLGGSSTSGLTASSTTGSPTFDMSLLDFNEQSIFLLEISNDPTQPVWDLFMSLDISGAFPEDVPALIAELSIRPIGTPRLLSQVPEPGAALLILSTLVLAAWRRRAGE